jgi:hypothetical protein
MDAMTINIQNEMVRALQRPERISYQPLLDGVTLSAEGGQARASLENLRTLLQHNRRVLGCICGPAGVLIVFQTGECYLATGFCAGSRGMRTKGFAQFSQEAGLGQQKDLLRFLSALPSDTSGLLCFPVQPN